MQKIKKFSKSLDCKVALYLTFALQKLAEVKSGMKKIKKRLFSICIYLINFILLLLPWITVGENSYNFFQFIFKFITQGTEKLASEAGLVATQQTTLTVCIIVEAILICAYIIVACIYVVSLLGEKNRKLGIVAMGCAMVEAFVYCTGSGIAAFGGTTLKGMAVPIGMMLFSFIEYPFGEIIEKWDAITYEAEQYKLQEEAEKREEEERLRFDGKYSKLFYYVVLKNFRKNWKDYVLVLICNVIIFSFIAIGFGTQDLLAEFHTYRGLCIFSGLNSILANALIPLAIISISVLVILFFYYLKCRAKNNGVFLTLGLRRKTLHTFIAVEFISVLIISIILGSILATGIMSIFVKHSNVLLGYQADLSAINYMTYVKSIYVIVLLYMVAVMASRDIFTDFNVGRSVDLRAMREKILRSFHLPFIIVGAIICIVCVSSYRRLHRFESLYLLAGAFVGIFFLIFFGLAKYLLDERKKPSYLKKLLVHNGLFHKSKTNSAFMYSLILLQFCAMFYFSFQIVSTEIAEDVDSLYPYDLVCIADDGDDDFFEELKEKYSIEFYEYPMVRVSNYDTTKELDAGSRGIQGQHIGISETTYHTLKKMVDPEYQEKDLGLDADGKYVYIVHQQDKSTQAQPIDYTTFGNTPLLHVGQPCQHMLSYSVNRGKDVTYSYKKISGEEIGSLTGIFRQGLRENIVVFSDEYFKEAQEAWKYTNILTGDVIAEDDEATRSALTYQGPTKLVLINANESDMDSILAEMTEFKERHVQDGKYDATVSSYYVKEEGVNAVQTERIMKKIMNTLLLILFFVMNLMLVLIKMLSEKDMNQKRVQFFNCMGMRKRDRIALLRKEILRYCHILPMAIALVLAIAFTMAVFHARMYTSVDIYRSIRQMVVLWGMYIGGSTVLLWIMVTIYTHKLEVENYGSNS